MPVRRSVIAERTQVGVESAIGTAVPANHVLNSLQIQPQQAANVSLFRGSASKYTTVQAINREWSTAPMTGQPTYDEIIFPLASVITAPVTTTPVGATLARQHVFTPSMGNPDSPKSFTIERGSSAAAERTAANILNEFAFNLNRNEAALTGTFIGQLLETGITLTASPTTFPQVPILPTQFDLFVDASWAALGTTKWTAGFVANWTIRSRYGQVWPINSAKPSWDDLVEMEPEVRLELQVENNATGQAFLTKLRTSGISYCRLVATGPEIEAGQNYLYQLDFVGVVADALGVGDQDGLYTLTAPLAAFDDGTNPAYEVTVVNAQTGVA